MIDYQHQIVYLVRQYLHWLVAIPPQMSCIPAKSDILRQSIHQVIQTHIHQVIRFRQAVLMHIHRRVNMDLTIRMMIAFPQPDDQLVHCTTDIHRPLMSIQIKIKTN